MPIPAQKTLIQNLNDINRLPENQHTLATSLQKASLLSQIAAHAKTTAESVFFLMQAISLLEALSMTLYDDEHTTENINHTYQEIQTQLALAYLELAKLQQEDKFYTLAKKLLKPFSKTGDAKVLQTLISIAAHQKEAAMCQFYLKKLLALPSFKADMLNQPELANFSHEDWYITLKQSVIFD